MSRTYLLPRGRTAKALAAVAVAMLVAGCGGGSSSGSDPSASAGVAGAAAQDTFNAQLADQHPGSKAAGAKALVATTSTPATTVASTPAATTPAPVTVTTVKPVTQIHVVTTPGRTRTVYVNRKVPPRVITRTRTKVVTHTVTQAVSSPVPTGAFTPSKHPALAQTRFMVPGGNLGCELSVNGARCDITQRSWAPPAQPNSCTSTYGNAIELGRQGRASFPCGGHSAISSGAEVVPVNWDDKIGHVTCQVRSFGLNCFSTTNHGFIISRTGYTLY